MKPFSIWRARRLQFAKYRVFGWALRQFFKAKKFAKALSKASRTKPLTQAEVDEALKISRFEGLKVRVDIKDLKGDHFVGGPHIHIEELHIRVEAGVTVTP